ncbi:hypothetical protein P5673_001796 [Acropora cervicornis]|uniref:CCHC-type domain-containing protein n=1 Tax=Acropora cervicornis TaxID=6130 RepID=A0AAD9VFM5_ACRCE|nr:hypothetical protein P5673_001796 [Acropora cervicornis]
MNSFNNKRQAYMYAKGFKLDKFLTNLQGYRIATGQLSKDEFKDVSDRYAYKDCGSSDDDGDDSKMNKSENSISSNSCSGSDDEDVDVDFFGLSSKQENSRLEHSGTRKTSGESSNKEQSMRHNTLKRSQPQQSIEAERQPVVWDSTKLKFKEQVSTLSTYKCWKCSRVGHLPDDCTVKVGYSLQGGQIGVGCREQKHSKRPFYSKSLKEYYKRCQMLRESKDANCSDCGGKSNLAYCLECGLTLCDGRGHLIDHLLEYPNHCKLYSFKLQRQVPSWTEVDTECFGILD